MAKNILFLADGTWNGPGLDDDEADLANTPDTVNTTNVFKTFEMLDGEDQPSPSPTQERERVCSEGEQVVQIAKYLHGVGDSRNWLVKLLGGAFGTGVVARIARGYTFISRHYEPGDRIVLVGFSRGAYTARALAGMITKQGLLDRNQVDLEDRQESYRLACAAWQLYRRPQLKENIIAAFDAVVRDLPAFLQSHVVADKLTGATQVQCVAVWDTVGAMGIPLYERRDVRWDSLQFTNRDLSSGVKRGYHAVAIDEQRVDFTPTLWNQREGVTQVLFAGAHADVGGGYAASESGLAYLALDWMREQLTAEEVLFKPADGRYVGSHSAGLHQPWLEPLWAGRVAPRSLLSRWESSGMALHPSVLARRQGPGPFPLYPSGSLAAYSPGHIWGEATTRLA